MTDGSALRDDAPVSRAPQTLRPWAVAMFSFTPDIVDGRRTPRQILLDAMRDGVADGVGLDGFQHFAGFPDVTHAEVEEFRDDVREHGLFLAELGLYDDVFVDPRRRASIDERASYLERQIRSAAALGFSTVKLGWGTEFELLDALGPCLESTGMRVVEEAQGPVRAGGDDYARRVDYASEHSDRFGFVFDLSAAMRAVPVTLLEELDVLGIPDEAIGLIAEEWSTDRDGAVQIRVIELTASLDLSPDARMRLMTPFTRFGNSHVAEFRDLLAHVAGVHAKFWDLNDDDAALSSAMVELDEELDRSGYAGPISSEWGGHAWLSSTTHDPTTMVAAHRALYREAVNRR